jgi:hypothetical protein
VLSLSRLFPTLAYAGVAFFFGLALGERGELGFVQTIFTAVIPLAAITLAAVAKQGKLHVLATGAAMLAGLVVGQRQFDRAWDDCIARAEETRATLVRYEAQHGGYPARLEDLGTGLPCRCGLRRTILHYMSNDRGFRLWFADDTETWVATDRSPFIASGRSSAPPRR